MEPGEELKSFSNHMVTEEGFRADKQEGLKDLFSARDPEQTGVLKGDEQGLAFIDEAFAAMTGRPDAKVEP